MTSNRNCKVCGMENTTKEKQFWNLQNYFGVTGYFCGDCFDLVSHDSYSKPNTPAEYTAYLLKFG